MEWGRFFWALVVGVGQASASVSTIEVHHAPMRKYDVQSVQWNHPPSSLHKHQVYESLSFRSTEGKIISIYMEHNTGLFAPQYREAIASVGKDGSKPGLIFNEDDSRLCHYKGHLQDVHGAKIPKSFVVLMSCSPEEGFLGSIHDGQDLYGIAPAHHVHDKQLLASHRKLMANSGVAEAPTHAIHVFAKVEKSNNPSEKHGCGVVSEEEARITGKRARDGSQKQRQKTKNKAAKGRKLLSDHDHDHDHAHDHELEPQKSVSWHELLSNWDLENESANRKLLTHYDWYNNGGPGWDPAPGADNTGISPPEKIANIAYLVGNDYLRWSQYQDYCAAKSIAKCQVEDHSSIITATVEQLYVNTVNYTPDSANKASTKATDHHFDPAIKIQMVGQVTFDNGDPWDCPTIGEFGGGSSKCTGNDAIPQSGVVCYPNCDDEDVSVDDLLLLWHDFRRSPGDFAAATEGHNNAHLYSGYDFEDSVVGYAGVNAMCNFQSSGGINMVDQPSTTSSQYTLSIQRNAATIAHEIGHNLGMYHDGSSNDCINTGNIMNAIMGDPPDVFSSCSVDYFHDKLSGRSCLKEPFTKIWGDADCGNGYVESGEDCDTGGADSTCCDKDNCVFINSATCAPSNHACCDGATCQPVLKADEVECRSASEFCDIPETCNGVDINCPINLVRGAGAKCTSSDFGEGMCYGGTCITQSQKCSQAGSNYQDAPYQACPADQQKEDERNSGNFCKTLLCAPKSKPTTCFAFKGAKGNEDMAMEDGIPCPGGNQCAAGFCQNPQALNQNLWLSSRWSYCSSCSQQQTRTTVCNSFSYTGTPLEQQNVVCTAQSKPNSSRNCLNPKLGCVHSSRNNLLNQKAREFSEKLGLASKGAFMRSLIPRVYGPTDFEYDNLEYWKGIGLVALIPGLLTLTSILATAGFYCCGSCCGNLDPNPKGYTSKQKCRKCGIMFVLLFWVLIWASLIMFFNGELSRGITDEEMGALPVLGKAFDAGTAVTTKLKVPANYITTESSEALSTSTSKLEDIKTALTTDKTIAFRAAITNYDPSAWVPYDRGTVSGTTSQSAYNNDPASTDTKWANPGSQTSPLKNMETEKTGLEDDCTVIDNMWDKFDSERLKAKAYLDELSSSVLMPTGEGSFSSLTEILESQSDLFVQQKGMITRYGDQLIYYEQYRYPFVLVLTLTPFGCFLAFVLASILKSGKMFKLIYHVGWALMIINLGLFAIHLPLTAIFSDTCDYMDAIEKDPKSRMTTLTTAKSDVLKACLANTSLLSALNMSTAVNMLERNISFEEDPANWSPGSWKADIPTIDKWFSIANKMSVQDFGFDYDFVEEQYKTISPGYPVIDLLKPLDDLTYRYCCCDGQPSGNCQSASDDKALAILAAQKEENAHLRASGRSCTWDYTQGDTQPTTGDCSKSAVATAGGGPAKAQGAMQTFMNDYFQDLADANEAFEVQARANQNAFKAVNTKMKPLAEAGFNMESGAYCDEVSVQYAQFKETFCGLILTSMSWMTFAFFFISMVMPFYLWASIRRAIMEEEPEMDLSSSQYNKHRHRKKVSPDSDHGYNRKYRPQKNQGWTDGY